MKKLLMLAFFPVVICCTTGNKDETHNDSTQLAADSISVAPMPASSAVATTPGREVIKNFPGMYTDPRSDDPREESLRADLAALVDQYDTIAFHTIKRTSSVTFDEEISPDEIVSITENETETWFLDSTYEVRAYSSEFDRRVGTEGYSTKTVIYLFDNNLIASYEDIEESEQEKYEMYNRALASRCPACGVSIHQAMNAGYSVDELNASHMEKMATGFYNGYVKLKSQLQELGGTLSSDGKYYEMKKERQREGVNYDDEYYVSRAVYDGYLHTSDEGD